jgi:tRNA-splicing ligase RtcB
MAGSRNPDKGTAPYRIWGTENEPDAIRQIEDACSLPIAVRGALMPDAHYGYGLPIGGVLATAGAVIPYAVGMDIACRMCMTVVDRPVGALDSRREDLRRALENETRFGVGAGFSRPYNEHPVMDENWGHSRFLESLKDRAWAQLGTSGSGNHFVEFGILTLDEADLGLEAGRYLALLSHSGSRGTGAEIATHYSRVAQSLHPELSGNRGRLAWLDLGSEAGQEYWHAMELMGRYAAANHELIHARITAAVGAAPLVKLENHHNFAWLEVHDGMQVVVHRKGATPAGTDAVGIIPGSMATPAYVVRGLGNEESLNSAAHGAGRRMSRKKAKKDFTWNDLRRYLDDRKVELISAGLDEVPMAYKDIDKVMAAQRDLVRKVARFDPKIVKMSPGGR